MQPSPVSSASPAPATRSSSFFPRPFRIADEDRPPFKRQRSSATPRPARASSSATPDDISNEREASVLRLHHKWSRLEEKYAHRMNNDDEIKLSTLEITKDRGVLEAATPLSFGSFADLEDSVDESTNGTDEEDEDFDELDSFATSDADFVPGWAVPTVPPVREMDPADAKDLEEFLEAEKWRREQCGEDVSQEGGDEDHNQDHSDDDTGDDADASSVPLVSHRPEVGSDDELDSWDILDESNIVRPVKKIDDSEIIEILDSPSVSPTHTFVPNSNITTPAFETPSHSKIRRAQLDKFKPPLQLATPPQSRTPSAEEVSTPFPSTSSPFPSSQPPSPTKPRPGTTPKPVSQVQTRSQSRARSPPRSVPRKHETRESVLRLDLADVHRGRSVHRSAPRTTKTVKETKASTRSMSVDRDSVKRSARESTAKASIRPSNDAKRDSAGWSSSSRPSPEPGSSSKRQEQHDVARKVDRKGKSRLMDDEPPLVDDRWRKGSSGPIDLPSSQIRRAISENVFREAPVTRQRDRPSAKQKSLLTFKEEDTLESVQQSPRKRKRKSWSSDSEGAFMHDFSTSSNSFDSSPIQSERRSSSVSTKSKSRKSVGFSHSDSEAEPEAPPRPSHRRPRAMSAAIAPQYPPLQAFYPYPPYPPDADAHPAMPFPDPRAQLLILQQAMHQLSSLWSAAPWPGQPLTPSHHTAGLGSSPYSYPSTPHRRHAHPYVFDSGASLGTLPPSSPPSGSPSSLASSPTHGHVVARRPSLVSRSRSRGRRVSFKLDREENGADEDVLDFPATHGSSRHLTTTEHEPGYSVAVPALKRIDKGKKNVANAIVFDADTRRGTVVAERAQTPGPSSVSALKTTGLVQPKGKTRKCA
ncbi:hypothetical protein GGX14DRAFT_542619 [Mycena pura]|uniref:Uncharacterized protein n=1 Tax=Mycena pura TaxID=153505 RepID=A0AAD6YBL1_9AGAR|nr:hypothetical protein GGX14DRAFT_542619 [Mycena pura]